MLITYFLTRRVLEPHGAVSITESEYLEIQQAREGLLGCLFIEEKFDLLIENYFEFETSLLDIARRYISRHLQDYRSIHLERNLMDRRLVNFLSAGRLYIDHTKQHVHRILPPEEGKLFDISKIFSHQYDTRFGYRCIEALRNHVQHRGVPVHSAMFGCKDGSHGNENLVQDAVTPYLEPARLREDGEFKKQILKEMEAVGDKIDLKSIVRDYVEGVSDVHSEIRSKLRRSIQEWQYVIHSAIVNYQVANPREGTAIGLAAVKRGSNGTELEALPVFTDFIDQYLYFQDKNDTTTNLTRRFVSGAVD